MKVAIYSRVSTDDKDQNPERQKQACQRYAEMHNHDVICYFEDKITGNSNPFNRKGFSELMKSKPDGILFYEISRFSRQHPSKVLRQLQDLKNRGIKTISITEQAFNMDGEFSDLIQYIMTWFNSYYLRNLSKNVKSGLATAVKNGKILGRPNIKINTFELIRLKNLGLSVREIAKEMKISYSKVQRCVKMVRDKTPELFINKSVVSKSGVFETENIDNEKKQNRNNVGFEE